MVDEFTESERWKLAAAMEPHVRPLLRTWSVEGRRAVSTETLEHQFALEARIWNAVASVVGKRRAALLLPERRRMLEWCRTRNEGEHRLCEESIIPTPRGRRDRMRGGLAIVPPRRAGSTCRVRPRFCSPRAHVHGKLGGIACVRTRLHPHGHGSCGQRNGSEITPLKWLINRVASFRQVSYRP